MPPETCTRSSSFFVGHCAAANLFEMRIKGELRERSRCKGPIEVGPGQTATLLRCEGSRRVMCRSCASRTWPRPRRGLRVRQPGAPWRARRPRSGSGRRKTSDPIRRGAPVCVSGRCPVTRSRSQRSVEEKIDRKWREIGSDVCEPVMKTNRYLRDPSHPKVTQTLNFQR